jgi:multiple sugar transport system permease protein
MSGQSTNTQQKLLWAIAILFVLTYALIPVLWLVGLSLKDPTTIGTDQSFLPLHNATFKNYHDLFTANNDFLLALRNSFGIAAIATLISIVLAAMAAYALARLEFVGKTLILSAALAIAMFPPISIVGSLFEVWRNIGLFDTWPGLIIPYMTFSLPLAIYTLSAFYREIPWELEQAAQMDGATPYQAFRRVILPLAAPGTFTAGILVFIFAWNDFLFANTLTSTTAARTVPASLAFFTGESQFQQPIANVAAAAVLVTIPIIIVVLIFQRRIVAGLTAGAVKG